MKNKGMHQQPNAFTPSTGNSAPQNNNMNRFQPTPSHGNPTQPGNWQKSNQGAPATASKDARQDSRHDSKKGHKGKKAA